MTEEIQLLNFIYENSEMGIISINDLLKEDIYDENFKKVILEQLNDYEKML